MYGNVSYVGLDELDVSIKKFHAVIFCFILSMEEHVETFISLHHGPRPFQVNFHAIDDAHNELQEFNSIWCDMSLIIPFSPLWFSLEGRLTLVCEQIVQLLVQFFYAVPPSKEIICILLPR